MRFIIIGACGAAVLGATLAASADAQGPVRQGLRRTGEAAVQGTRRVVEGAGDVLRGAGRAAAGVADGTVDAGRAVIGGTARGIDRGVRAVTPGIPWQARAGAGVETGRDARWRFAQHNGEWWYYAPDNSWRYHRDGQWNRYEEGAFEPSAQFAESGAYGQGDQGYAAGYRGVDGGTPEEGADYGPYLSQGAPHDGRVYPLQVDRCGREFICVQGRRVYLDSSHGHEGSWGQGSQQYQSGYGQRDDTGAYGQPYGDAMTPTPQIPDEAGYNAADAPPATPEAFGRDESPAATASGGVDADAAATTGGFSGSADAGVRGEADADGSSEPLSGAIEGELPPQ